MQVGDWLRGRPDLRLNDDMPPAMSGAHRPQYLANAAHEMHLQAMA